MPALGGERPALRLVLRLYDTPVAASTGVLEREGVPAITRLGCTAQRALALRYRQPVAGLDRRAERDGEAAVAVAQDAWAARHDAVRTLPPRHPVRAGPRRAGASHRRAGDAHADRRGGILRRQPVAARLDRPADAGRVDQHRGVTRLGCTP
jgi:hypothetical protein